jgi:AbrB family looped-hinge helix DNA binding protein
MNCTTDTCTTCEEQYELEAVVSFDERGQLVLPKDVRKKFNLEVGEKLALISCMNEQGVCCFTLVRTKNMQDLLKKTIPF